MKRDTMRGRRYACKKGTAPTSPRRPLWPAIVGRESEFHAFGHSPSGTAQNARNGGLMPAELKLLLDIHVRPALRHRLVEVDDILHVESDPFFRTWRRIS